MIAIEGDHILLTCPGRSVPTYWLPLLRLERCPFCGEEIVRAWFGLPEGVREIPPVRYEGLAAREDYKSAFHVVLAPGYQGLVRRSLLHWHDSSQSLCRDVVVCPSPSRPANLQELLHHLRRFFSMGKEGEQITTTLDSLSHEQWDDLAREVLGQYLGVPFGWGEIRAPREELSGESSPILVLKEAERPEGDRREWRDRVTVEFGCFLQELVAPVLHPGRGERYAQIRPW